MDLHAYTRTISDLFSVKKKYIVPRFQREYSWEREEVLALWEDVYSNIKVLDKKAQNQEYFIGALVLIGEDKSFEMQIVDGQQRLTTLTILLSALVETFKKLGKTNIAQAIQENYIQGKDDESKDYFKLINETPKPYFQTSIQAFEKQTGQPTSEEERTLIECYNEYIKRLDKKEIFSGLYDFDQIEANSEEDRYYKILLAVRDQILNFLKVIYITVKDEEDAYTIFETLNARGMNLSAVDLIKNDIFRDLKSVHPDDTAKTKWKAIRTNLIDREDKINVDTFFRHYWLSKYSFTSEDRIYRTFKRLTKTNKINTGIFLTDLVDSSKTYNLIANPSDRDWKQQEEKLIYEKLIAFKLFRVTQIRSLVLALLDLRTAKLISLSELINFLEKLETFHFVFTAICSSRSSGLEGKYSKTARTLRSLTSKTDIAKQLTELATFLKQKMPTLATFTEGVARLDYELNKPLLQYMFRKHESFLRHTKELKTDFITLEHILSKNSISALKQSIGNLLPLDRVLNDKSEDKDLKDKIVFYKTSELKVVAEFVSANSAKSKWADTDIENRTKTLAKKYYEEIWKL